jgi:septal ring factor EnvC (AmiA/AmiB activator)
MTTQTNIATKLGDLKLIQNVLIEYEQKLMAATNDQTIRERLEKMLESDRQNLSDIDETIAKFGNAAQQIRSSMNNDFKQSDSLNP